MSDQQCDIHDVTKAASDLMSLGCTASGTYLSDSLAQVQFSSFIANYVNEIIRDVNEGIITAWDGVQELRAEYDGLIHTTWFYARNGIGVAAGVMQVEVGVAISASSGGLAVIPGTLLAGHGVNNIYEGIGNIHNGPEDESITGPTRAAYQAIFRGEHRGNMAYYTTDFLLSGFGLLHSVRKSETTQLFVRDSINYEKAHRQTSSLAMFFEGLIDSLTIDSLHSEYLKKTQDNNQN